MGVVSFLFLGCLGLAITVQAQNCSSPVPGPNMYLRGSPSDMFTDGTKVYFSCEVGYISGGGSPSITCTAGSWSPVRLKCERKSCGTAGEVTNGYIDYPVGNDFGDKAVITCDTGYRLVGKREIFCEARGWSSRLPDCEEVTCDSPPEIVNGAFSPVKEEYSYRDVVQYRCEYQYILNGSKTIICSEEGTFKPDPPTCVKEVPCENPDVDHGVWIEGSRPPYKFSATVTFECQSGYTMKGARTQTCDRNGKWSPGLPTCEPKNCSRPEPGPNMGLKGNNTLSQTFLHGTTVSLACNVGYTSRAGSADITCTAGSWSHVTLICKKKSCGSAEEVTNGRIDYPEGKEFGDKAVIRCDTGYRLLGTSEITCEDQGWSDKLAVCEVVKCDPPPEIGNGAFSLNKDSYVYLDVVQYSCKNYYTLSGSPSRTCSADGTFKPDPPTCVMIQCETPVVANSYWVECLGPPFRPLSNVIVECRPEYIMKGERSQTCDRNGKWSPGLPTCERVVKCTYPKVPNGYWVDVSQPPFRLSNVIVECRAGYAIKGEGSQTCDRNGEWSPGLPTCELDKGYNTQDIAKSIIFFALGFFVGGAVTGFLLWVFLKKRKGSLRTCPDKNCIEENGKDSKEGSELVALSNCNSPVGPT